MKILNYIFFFLTLNLASQEITGFVYNNNGYPIPNVNISVKDSDIGTQSDENGKFTLDVNIGNIVVVSHLNYFSYELKIENLDSLIINLDAKINLLDEVTLISKKANNRKKEKLITTAFGKLNPKSVGYSIYSLYKDDLQKSTALNVEEILIGKVPSYKLIPNYGVVLRPKGIGPIRYALWDIDGMVFEGIPPYVDVSLIESIHVISSPSRSLIYGPKGSGGIIIVNTLPSTSSEYDKSYPQLYSVEKNKVKLPNNEKEIKEIINQNRFNLDKLKLMAYIFKSRGNINLALKIYQQILAYDLKKFTSHRDIAETLLQTNKKNKAWNIYKRIIGESLESVEETHNIMFHDIERLYHSYGLKKTIDSVFKTEKDTYDVYNNETRIVFEWSVPNETLFIELINPQKKLTKIQLGNKYKNSKIDEIFIDQTLKGKWKLNLSIPEAIKANGYLKITIYRNWISSNKILPESSFYLLKGVNQTKYKLLDLKIN